MSVDKTVIILSGGLDSSVLAYYLKSKGHTLHALGINYGQRHGKELSYASMIANRLEIPLTVVDVRKLKEILAGSSQTSDSIPVPHGYYTSETMKQTVVPNRNMIMLSIACGFALSIGYTDIAYAAHSGDHAIYPDCRPQFVNTMREAFLICDWNSVTLHAPFINTTKSRIVSIGSKLLVPFELTWSCYEAGELHCGLCGTCRERIEAFLIAGVNDPTEYLSDEYKTENF